MEDFKNKFFELVDSVNSIVITSHISPDDDSIGSVLLVYHILRERYPDKDVNIIYTGQSVDRYSIFKNFEKIKWVDDIANHLERVDALITVDASNWRRFSKNHERLLSVPVRIGFDHHASVPDNYTLLLHKEEYSSNVELVFRTLVEGNEYSKDAAEYTLLGIIGDTGGLSYVKPSQSSVFVLAKELVERIGIPINEFCSHYMSIPLKIIPLLQELVRNTTYQKIGAWPPVQYTFIKSIDKYSDEDMSAASHIYMSQYLTRVQNYTWGFVITPRVDSSCRMSGRSLPHSVSVKDFHERLGIGSGHVHASGGYFNESNPEICLQKVLDFMKSNDPVLS